MKDGTVIYAPPDIAELLEKGGKELSSLEARKLILPSGASCLKQNQMVETLAKVEGMPASALNYTRRIFPKGQKSGQWLGSADATLNRDIYTKFEAYGDLAILSDEQRVEGIFSALVDTDTVKPGTLKAAKDLKKLKQNEAKIKNLLKQGYTKEDFLRMDSLRNLIQRPEYAPLVDQATIDRYDKFHDPLKKWSQRSENARAARDQARALGGIKAINQNLDGTMAFHAGLAYDDILDMARPVQKAADMAWDFGEKGRDMNLAALDNLRAPMALSEGATVAGKLARKAGALVPFAGAAFDTIDAADKIRRAHTDPTFLNNLQAAMAAGTVGTSFWNEPTNFALGIGNLAIDVGRGAHSLITDEEAREKAYNTFRALGQGSLKALGLLKY